MKVTILGTLPPITGISPYCYEQTNSLSKLTDIQFINFKSIYPKIFYKWTIKEHLDISILSKKKNVVILPIINWYDPLSWISAGLSVNGDIFHFHWWTFYLFPIIVVIVLIAKIKRKKIICTVHNSVAHETNIFDLIFSKIILSIPNKLIVHSSEMKLSLINQYGINKYKISIIPHGPLDFYKDKKISKQYARQRLKLDNNSKIILFFGTIREYKGVDVLIKALSEVKKQIKKVKLVIAGEAWVDWKLYDNLIKELSLKKDIITNIEFIPTPKIKYYLIAADLLVLPYKKFESQTSVGAVGLAFDKAMIVSKVGGLPKLVKNNNYIIKPNNPTILANAIIKVLKNKKIQKKLEIDSSEIAKEFSWTKIAEKTLLEYKKC